MAQNKIKANYSAYFWAFSLKVSRVWHWARAIMPSLLGEALMGPGAQSVKSLDIEGFLERRSCTRLDATSAQEHSRQ